MQFSKQATLTSLSSLQATAVLLDAELFAEPTVLRASPSNEAALTLGGVREAAAQPIETPSRVQPCAELEEGCEHTRCGRYATVAADRMGVTAAVGRSWL